MSNELTLGTCKEKSLNEGGSKSNTERRVFGKGKKKKEFLVAQRWKKTKHTLFKLQYLI